MTRNHFKDILQNIHFADNQASDTTDKGYKVSPLIRHLNSAVLAAMSNADQQSADEHMTKLEGKSSMKQYLKLKRIKWGFKSWFHCVSKTAYL